MTVTIPAPPVTDRITLPDGRRRLLLLEPFTLHDGETRIRIPAGFLYDDASSPRPVWALVSPSDCGEAAPLVHDALYQYGGHLPPGWCAPFRLYSRQEADALFSRTMEAEGVRGRTRRWAWLAVRIFGGLHSWRKPQAAERRKAA